jgi:hypothetical protein
MFVSFGFNESFGQNESQTPPSGCGETHHIFPELNGKDKIKAGRDSPLIESRPAFSLAVGIVLSVTLVLKSRTICPFPYL